MEDVSAAPPTVRSAPPLRAGPLVFQGGDRSMTTACQCGNPKTLGPSEADRIRERLALIRMQRAALAEEEGTLQSRLTSLIFPPPT